MEIGTAEWWRNVLGIDYAGELLGPDATDEFGGRSKRQKLLDEAYAAAMKKLREQHEAEFQRYLVQEKEKRNVGPGNKTESEVDVFVITD